MSEEVLEQEPKQLDRKDLKILALQQKLAKNADEFADLQVDYTIISDQAQKLADEIGRLNGILEEAGLNTAGEPIEPDVPSGDLSKD